MDIPVLLPEAPDASDACVERLVKRLSSAPGLFQVHVAETNGASQLCLHYDPAALSPADVRRKALQAGAEISQRFGHLIGWVEGVRHARHARRLEAALAEEPGVLEAALDVAGALRLEFDHTRTSRDALQQRLADHRLRFSHSPFPPPPERFEPEKGDHDHEGTGEHADHDHAHGGVFGANTELVFALGSGSALGIGFAHANDGDQPSVKGGMGLGGDLFARFALQLAALIAGGTPFTDLTAPDEASDARPPSRGPAPPEVRALAAEIVRVVESRLRDR
jgi:Cd2+/Zn2+-exporting ATPase